MSFLERFTPEQRRLFEGAATTVEVPRGHYLMRRGEPGGDVFLLKRGSFEVVDNRTTPEVILAVLEEGAVVGEMAFVDDSPRSADVRACADGEVMRWARDDLRGMLQRQPALAALFYESIAKLAAKRSRDVTTTAMAGALTRQESRSSVGIARIRDEVRRIADRTKEGLLEAETRLRQDHGDRFAEQRVGEMLDTLSSEIRQIQLSNPDLEVSLAAAKLIARELHPYLVRSSLAERCIRRAEGVGGAADVLSHVLLDTAGGDGQIGELIDRWLLDRPTFAAYRSTRDAVVNRAVDALPAFRNRRVLILNAGTGSMIANLAHELAHPPTVITVVDQSRDALAFLDSGVTMWPHSVELKTLQENLAAIAMGRTRPHIPPQDVVIVQGMLEYLPERIAISLLDAARQMLAPTGVVIASALAPSDDHGILDWLLGWPTIRRSHEVMRRMFLAASLDAVEQTEIADPAMVFVGAASAVHHPALTPVIAARRAGLT